MGRRVLAILVAAVVAVIGVAAVLVYARGADQRAVAAQQPTDVYVATKAVSSGTMLKDAIRTGAITKTSVASKGLPVGALTRVTDSNSSLLALTDIQPGEYVLSGRFGTTPVGTKAIEVPAGMVAVSVQLTDPARVGTFVTPGTRLAIFDDEAMVRVGLRMVLSAEPDLEVVGEAADGAAAVELVEQVRPDVVLMDVRMPVVDGIEGSRRVLAASPQTKVVILTTFGEDEYLEGALRAGVSGFLLKVSPPEQLIEAVRAVAAGGGLLDPSVTLRVIESFAAAPPGRVQRSALLDTLTAREKDVLALLARGLSNAEIAADLYLGEATVKTHVSSLLMKLGLRDRVQAVVAAYETGLVRPGEAPA